MAEGSSKKTYNNKSKNKSKSNNNNKNKSKSNKQKQNNGYAGRYINHETNMNSKSNIMNSTSVEELLQQFFKRDSLLNWQLSLINRINQKVNTFGNLNLDRRTAYNDMMSYRNYHSKNKTRMDNDDIALKVARVLISN